MSVPESVLEPLDLRSGTILGDAVYTQISAAILDGRLEAGVRLRDVDLAEQLGVSRTPVREALQRLERIGMVEVAVGRYTRVSVPDDKLRTDTREFVIYAIGAAMRMAAVRANDEDWAHFLDLFDDVIDAVDDIDRLIALSARAYEQLTRISDNSVFVSIMRETSLSFQRTLAGWPSYLTDPDERRASYLKLRAALAERDGPASERVLREQHGLG